MAKKKAVRKKKKKVTKKTTKKSFEVTWQGNCSKFSNPVKALEYEDDYYVRLEDIMLDYANQWSNNRSYNEFFMLRTLTHFADPTDKDFWENEKYEKFQDFYLRKCKDEYNGYHISMSMMALFESNKTDDYKLKAIKQINTMPGTLFRHILDNDVHEDIKAYTIDNYKIPSDIATNIVLGGESKRLVSLAVRHLDIDDVDCPDLLAIIACSNINRDKRVKAIEKICNTDVLKKIVFESDDFEIIKKARTRIKELPNALRFIVDDKPTYKVA